MTTFFAGDQLAAADLEAINVATVAKPIGRLIAQSAQVLADNTNVPINFGTGSTVYDTNNFHSESTNLSRVTPSVAGYYRFSGTGFFEAEATPVIASVAFRLNGTTTLAAAWRYPGSTQAFSGFTQVTIAMNGTTDYVELMALQDSAGADNTNASLQFSSALEWEYIRPL